MKSSFFLILTLLFISCSTTKSGSQNHPVNAVSASSSTSTSGYSDNVSKGLIDSKVILGHAKDYATIISEDDLKVVLYTLADDKYQGRRTGEKGQKLAANYIVEYYHKLGLKPANSDGNYLQNIPVEYFRGWSDAASENVIAYIEGSEKPNEFIVISAHYDHLGVKDEKIYNGADDNASGTTAVLLLARAFQKAVENGNGPKRSIVFLHVTGEEEGLLGSRYYSENPIFPLDSTVVNLNIDMLGRFDQKHADDPDYVYLIGSDKLSTELHKLSEAINKKYTNLKLDYTYNHESDPNRFYYRSDHYNFAKNGVPIIFYFNGVHEDYHKETDTPDKIQYDLLQKRAQLVFYTAWEIANKERRLQVDKK